MNQHLQNIIDFLQQNKSIPAGEKSSLLNSLNDAGKELEITAFKLDRTEKVKRTTAILLEETIEELEQKRKALEAQNRELEVESSLERVRTVAMSMKKPDDMLDVCRIISGQLEMLGTKEIRNVQTAIFYPDKGTYINYEYYRLHDKLLITEVDYRHDAMTSAFASKMLKGTGEFFTESLTGKLLKDWFEYQKTTPQFADPHLAEASSLNYYWFSLGPIALGISTYAPLAEDEINLFKRFRNVFELSYRRFLDIEKAEAQAKEARVEAALERVRSRTMAMHKSDELAETVSVVFKQLLGLGVRPGQIRTCAIVTFHTSDPVGECFITTPDGEIIPHSFRVPYDEVPSYASIYAAWKRGEKFHVVHLSGDALVRHMNYLKKHTGIPTQQFQPLPDQPAETYTHALFFSQGYLFIISGEPLPQYHDIFKRFGAVFQQTYTRFLDLKKAEAQAREAHIEASLERVRSKAMSMQKSGDLGMSVSTIFEELENLDHKIIRCGIAIHNRTKEKADLWTTTITDKGRVAEVSGDEAMDIHPMLQGAYDSWLVQTEYSYVLEGEDLLNFYKAIASTNFTLPASQSIDMLREGLRQYLYVAHFTAGGLYAFSEDPFSEEARIIIRRFADVFNLAYTRFNDLQNAEAQAREATIEAALEKVRGRAMAMHESKDLSATASKVFTELRKLGIKPIRCGVGLLTKESRKAQLYSATSSSGSDSLALIGWVVLSGHRVLENIYETWITNEDYFPILSGEELKSYYELLLSGLTVPFPDWESGQKQYGHFFPFSVGCLYGWSEYPYSDAEIKVLKRFASIIDLTFRRYIELQKSEANAREAVRRASLDRVRAETASMRTTADLERITPLIWNELTTLGVPFTRCGVFIMDEQYRQIHTFLSTPDGQAIAAFHLSYDTPGTSAEVVAHWHRKEMYREHWNEAAFIEWTTTLIQQGAITSSEKYLTENRPTHLDLHFIPFLQGMLYVGSETPLSDEELHLVKNLAGAFSNAYARYEDFNKLESAKIQIEKTLVDLRQAQAQLVQSEKMASLGELTAGIAHEIQNPLNFVNNFSEVNTELLDELQDEIEKGNLDEVTSLAKDIRENEEKINHHGKRADSIVKGMLLHSRSSSGIKEPTDLNALTDEYLRLSYHGLRAKDKMFNATLKMDYDEQIGTVRLIPQDIGRLLLNLYNNAFYAVTQKKNQQPEGYEPTISISTKKIDDKVEIRVGDNGTGIPQKVFEKIFQPFFTTKPTGQGTGLGLSLSYDIVKAHGGEIKVETQENTGCEFIIQLPYA